MSASSWANGMLRWRKLFGTEQHFLLSLGFVLDSSRRGRQEWEGDRGSCLIPSSISVHNGTVENVAENDTCSGRQTVTASYSLLG